MEGQTSFINPIRARERDLSQVRMPDGALYVDDILNVVPTAEDEEARTDVAAGQQVLDIGELGLSTTVEDPRQ